MKLLLHSATQQHVRQLSRQPHGTILLHGPEHTGKFTAAYEVARKANCLGCKDASCKSCLQAAALSHPDIIVVSPDDKQKIGIQAVHELHHKLVYGRYEQGQKRVVIIRNAQLVTLVAQQALLKLLEEPPTDTVIILTATSQTALLETIISRCRPIYFSPLKSAVIGNFLVSSQGVEPEIASQIAQLSNGAVGRAIQLAQDADQRARYNQIAEQSQELVDSPQLFSRLQVAQQIASQTDNLQEYLQAIVRWGRNGARNDVSNLAQNLAAIERLRRRIEARVSPKAAFEAFAVEVIC